MRDIYELAQRIDDKLETQVKGCAACKAGLEEKITGIDGRVVTLENERQTCRANRRSWRDYVVNGGFLIISAVVGVAVSWWMMKGG